MHQHSKENNFFFLNCLDFCGSPQKPKKNFFQRATFVQEESAGKDHDENPLDPHDLHHGGSCDHDFNNNKFVFFLYLNTKLCVFDLAEFMV